MVMNPELFRGMTPMQMLDTLLKDTPSVKQSSVNNISLTTDETTTVIAKIIKKHKG